MMEKIMNYTETQSKFLKEASEFLRDGKGMKTLCGYAGTGKTTCMSEIYRNNKEIVFLCPTHQAKKQLLTKLIPFTNGEKPKVMTTTSFLRDCKGTLQDSIESYLDLLSLDREANKDKIKHNEKLLKRIIKEGRAQNPEFTDKELSDEENVTIVVEEGSMSTRTDRDELLSRCDRMLVIGDGFQAPPVVNDNDMYYEDWFFKHKHDWKFDEVLRNDAGILELATLIRNTDKRVNLEHEILELSLPDIRVLPIHINLIKKAIRKDFMFLSFKNEDVDRVCFYARKANNLKDNTLTPKDELYCANNFDKFKNKDEICVKSEINFLTKSQFSTIVNLVDGNKAKNAMINTARIRTDLSESQRKRQLSEKGLVLRYGYARTIHGSQGSEWNNVVYSGDIFQSMNKVLHNRLIYTAVTRAKKNFALMKIKK